MSVHTDMVIPNNDVPLFDSLQDIRGVFQKYAEKSHNLTTTA